MTPSVLSRLAAALPQGRTLPATAWELRHRAMLRVLAVHAVAVPLLALALDGPGAAAAVAAGILLLFLRAARLPQASHGTRACAVALGLLSASVLLVVICDGVVKAEFHFFVVIAMLALYEDWRPLGVGVGFVVAADALLVAVGLPAAEVEAGESWLWAPAHALFVCAAAGAGIAAWRFSETARAEAQASSERFRLAFDGAPIGMLMTDARPGGIGRILRVNHAFERIVGRSV